MRVIPSALRLPCIGGLIGWVSIACTSSAGPATHDAAAEARPDRGPTLCDRYQALATSPPSFGVVQQIFDDQCVSCHVGAGNVDLTDGRSWMNLVNQAPPASEACGGILVVPGDPASSYLYQKLTSTHPCSGQQMPISDLFTSIPLPACVTGIIGDWIAAGAPPAGAAAGDAGGG
jgi:hypothetical protein